MASKITEIYRQCEGDIEVHQQELDNVIDSFGKSLRSVRSRAEQTAHNRVELGKLKAQLRELDAELVKALAVKTRKESKKVAIQESLSETRVKVEELHNIVRDQAARKDQLAAIISQQLKGLTVSKEKSKQVFMQIQEMREACSWYNRVLGFRIDGGHGIKFTFTNVNRKCPAEEYSFTIRLSNDLYTLLDCSPPLDCTVELVNELNKNNTLFKFIRIMRQKFQAAASGSVSHFICQDQDTASVSFSAPVSSVSGDSRSQSPRPLREANTNVKKDNPAMEVKSPIKKVNQAKAVKSPMRTPVSAASVRKSPRLVNVKERTMLT